MAGAARFFVAGGVISAAILLALGNIELAGNFAANVAGAAIGGMISIGLAVMMFAHERRVAARDAAALAASQREQTIMPQRALFRIGPVFPRQTTSSLAGRGCLLRVLRDR